MENQSKDYQWKSNGISQPNNAMAEGKYVFSIIRSNQITNQ